MAIAATMSLVYAVLFATAAYVVPGYSSFKAIEKKSDAEVRDWGIYWVVLSVLYCSQWLLDLVLCWIPFYYVAKLGFIVALWHPSTKLAQTAYVKGLGPLLASYEADIDRAVAEARTKAADLMGQHASQLKTQARKWSSQASVALKNVQQKALEKAQAARSKGPSGGATTGLHSE